MDPNKTFFIHLRYFNQYSQPTNSGGVTIAYKDEGSKLRVAFSRCNWKDNFCRRIGRNIATGRLRSGDCYLVDKQDTEPPFDTVVRFVSEHIPNPV